MKQAVEGPAPAGAYSSGILASGRLVFVSGQGPLVEGVPALGTIEEETGLTLDNVGAVLEAAGASYASAVRCTVYLADIADFGEMNAVYAGYFPDPKPARTTVGAQLAGGIRVEIDCIAVATDDVASRRAA